MRHCNKQKKSWKIRIWILIVLLIMVCMSIWGTLADYISRSYVKGVATTPKQDFELSSDYLSVVSKNADTQTYPDRKIVLTEKEETDNSPYTFSFSIMNTADGSVSTKRMQYYLKMNHLPEGAVVRYGNDEITSSVSTESGYKASVMNAYTRVTHTYTVIIPKDKIISAADIIITATPDADSDTSGFILAGRLQPSILGTVAAFSYESGLLESGNVKDYAAFNYQISVSNAEEDRKMKLSWNKNLIEIDPLFLEKFSTSGNPGTLTLTMNDTNSSYLIQFYRLPGKNIDSWEDLGIEFEPVD